MVAQVNSMLQDNQNLISEFHKLLPEEDVATKKTEFDVPSGEVDAQLVLVENNNGNRHAKDFVNRIRQRFADRGADTYQRFVSLLQNYLSGMNSLDYVVQEVKQLFQGQEDLIKDFICFLPPESRQSAVSLIQASPANGMPTNIASAPVQLPSAYYPFLPSLVPSTAPPLMYQPIYSSQSYPSVPVMPAIPLAPQRERETLPKQHSKKSYADNRVQLRTSDIHSLESLRTLGGARKYLNFVRICLLFNKVRLFINSNNKEIISLAEFISLLQMLYPKQVQILHTIETFLAHHGIHRDFVFFLVFIYSRLLLNRLLCFLNKSRNYLDVLRHIIFFLLITFIVEDRNELISRDRF